MTGFRNAKAIRAWSQGGLAVLLVLLGQFVLLPEKASAAGTTFTVSTTADIAANAGACGNSAITTPPSPLSLREATCLANNVGGTVTINVPAGHFILANGELAPGANSGQNVSIVGAGSASTIIDANNASRVLDIDSSSAGNVAASISGVTIANGNDSTGNLPGYGGAGILDGSVGNTADTLTVSNSVFSNNTATNGGGPGGAIGMAGGNITITNTTFTGNHALQEGSAVYFTAQLPGQTLDVSGSTFSGNVVSVSAGHAGGALYLDGNSGVGVFNVSNNTFSGNQATETGSGLASGAAISQTAAGTLTATENNFTGNSVSGAGSAGAAIYSIGTANLHYNRIVGNTGAGVVTNSGGTMDAGDNWWGCNTGPNSTGCDTESGTAANLGAYLKLVATATPSHVVGPNGTATITAALTTDSLGATVGGSNLDAFATLPVSFADPAGDATVTLSAGSHTAAISSGTASIDYHSNTTVGPDNDAVTFDNATVNAVLEVDVPPTITSPNTANFNIGTAGSYTVTTTGYPSAGLTETGSLPAGLTFTDNGDGTATIGGTATGPGGSYPITVTANNGIAPNATQTLTISVGQPPAFTSASTATFTIGTSGSFSVTTSGVPTVSTISESGSLPAGITFTDNGDGTATIAGTPTGTGGTFPVTLSATNGVAPNASQALTIQVNQAPAITANPSNQTVQPGDPVTFTAAASGVPTPSVQWQVSTDGGISFTNIPGASGTSYTHTAALGEDGNQYRAVFTNVVGTATTTAATLSVGTAPTFTSADNTRFVVGTAGSFTITTNGVPNATLSRTGVQFPAWLTLTDNGDGTGALTGTPPAGSGGSYTFTLKAANGFSPSASQIFTLFVDQSPVITSANHATFTAGSANTFAVTTTAGAPTTTALSATGALPSGVSFTDNGDGTATLAGTPAAGTGGVYAITVQATATGGSAPAASQSFTLTVDEVPSFTSTDHATFAVGTAGTFSVTTANAYPVATSLTKTGILPPGVTLTDNGDGTATLAGTPNAGTGGVYTLTLTATNAVGHTDQTFTLTVNEPPTISSANHATFIRNTAAAFTVTTAGGQPAAVTITESGPLPAGVTFTDNGDGTATLGGTPTVDGSFALTITASNGVLPDATQTFTLTVNAPPAITSADHTTFTVGTAGTFTVTTTAGTPTATTIVESGALPSGVSFTDNGDGTATLAGTPAAGTGGSYPVTITAGNGVLPNASQPFTLTVNEPAHITSADHTAFVLNGASSFTVTTASGYPTAVTLTETGALPAGVSFTDNGDGTGTLAGTPTAAGSFPVTLTASNGVSPAATQAFTLTVNAAPVLTSADHTTFAVGSAGTFTVTTNAGVPATTTITETGPLPSGVSFTDNGDGTATLAGTPAATTGGSYPLTITASNGVNPDAQQAFTLTVTELPAITSANHAAFTVGTAGSFAVITTAGYPAATTLTETGALPVGVSLTDNGDGTATLAGTPAAGSGGTYPITLTATNSAGHVDQAFTLTVYESTVITSADHATFTAGTPGSFTVTTSGGFPTPPALTESGALPAGVSFTDNGDGTATLAGTAAGGGSYPLTITASNGQSVDASQSFTLTVDGPPSITSAATMTFTQGVAGTFTVTTQAGVPATPEAVTEAGTLPAGVSFTDNGDGTATLAGTATATGTFHLSITASNGVAPDATQAFTLIVASAGTAVLPSTLPGSTGVLHGVPTYAVVGQLLHLSGSGFAAGAPVTIGIYSAPLVLTHVRAGATGTFTATVRVPNRLGRHTFVAAGTARNGHTQYLETSTVISPAPVRQPGDNPGSNNGSGLDSGSAGLANTGPDTDPRTTAGWALGMLLFGLVLVVVSRRRRRG